MKKKLLYFDYWPFGVHQFNHIHKRIVQNNIEVKLVHLASWNNPKTPIHEVAGDGIQTYDISYYGTNFIHRVLESEKPDAVLALNAFLLPDRALFMSCQCLGIKSIYMMHGVLPSEESMKGWAERTNTQYKEKRTKVAWKYLKNHIPNYFYSGLKKNPLFALMASPYSLLLKTFLQPGNYMLIPPPSSELIPDLALVYSKKYCKYFTEKRGFSENKVKIVGDPNLDSIFNSSAHHQSRTDYLNSNNISTHLPLATYIEDAFVEANYDGWTQDSRVAHFKEIEECCCESGYHLVIKLHPTTARSLNVKAFGELRHSSVIEKTNLNQLIEFSDICIGHISTAINLPIVLDKPILIPRWGISKNIAKYFDSNVVTYCDSLDVFRNMLKQKTFVYDRTRYIEQEITYTDGRASDRIVNCILEAM